MGVFLFLGALIYFTIEMTMQYCPHQKSEITNEQKTLYIITPTYPRPEQLSELTRLSQTLMVNVNAYFLHRNFDEKN